MSSGREGYKWNGAEEWKKEKKTFSGSRTWSETQLDVGVKEFDTKMSPNCQEDANTEASCEIKKAAISKYRNCTKKIKSSMRKLILPRKIVLSWNLEHWSRCQRNEMLRPHSRSAPNSKFRIIVDHVQLIYVCKWGGSRLRVENYLLSCDALEWSLKSSGLNETFAKSNAPSSRRETGKFALIRALLKALGVNIYRTSWDWNRQKRWILNSIL
jgi:hypothetical protein